MCIRDSEKANEVCDRLKKICSAGIDVSENTPGWKFAEYEMKGVPIRGERGPKDIEKNQCVIVTRHNREKTFVSLDELETVIPQKLEEVRNGLYAVSYTHLDVYKRQILFRLNLWSSFNQLLQPDSFLNCQFCL